MNDTEAILQTLVTDAVEDALGPRTAPPPFAPSSTVGRPARRMSTAGRLRPLLAAAAVIAVAGAVTALAVTTHGPDRERIPTEHESTPSVSYRSLGGARIALPKGWVVRPFSDYLGSQEGLAPVVKQSWCLSPASVAPSTAPRACPVQLSTIKVVRGQQVVDPDIEEGLPGNPEYCMQGHQITAHAELWDARSFGGRSAEWRKVDITCRTRARTRFEQYVVGTLPAYIVYAAQDSVSTHAALNTMARYSTMPEQTAPYRLSDLGVITALTTSDGHSTVSIARRVHRTDTFTYVREPGTATYVVPAKVMHEAGGVHKGTLVGITTDGTTVEQLFGVR